MIRAERRLFLSCIAALLVGSLALRLVHAFTAVPAIVAFIVSLLVAFVAFFLCAFVMGKTLR